MKLIKYSLFILFLVSLAYPANAATIDLVGSTVEYTDLVDHGGILEFVWSTPGLNNEEVRYLIKNIPSEFDVSEANVQISSNKGTFDKAIKSSKIALKSTAALTGNLEVKIKIPIPPDCPENTYTLEISEMVGSDSDMLSPSSIDITVQKSSTKPSTPILNDPGTTDNDGSYTVSWSSVSGATSYTLEEDTSSSFSSPTLVHSGSGTSKYVTGKSNGTYYYRVKACNACGCSGWSNVEDIEVSIQQEEGWEKTFGGPFWDEAYDVQQTSDGGYILAGYTHSFSCGWNDDIWLVKTDPNGNEQWNRTFGGTGDDFANSVDQTADGGYIIFGHTDSYGSGSRNFWLVKTDCNGNEQWNRTFGGPNYDWGFSVQQTADGGFILAGTKDRFGACEFWLAKTDSNGNEQWNMTFSRPNSGDEVYSVQQTADGGYILAGSTGGAGFYDFWLVKTDSNGNEQWNKIFGGNGREVAYDVQQTKDRGYILVGTTGYYDFWLVKTDSNGNEQWNHTFGGSDYDIARSIHPTSDGGYILAGYTASYGAGLADVWLVKTDTNGSEQWNRTFGGPEMDRAYSVQQTSDGGHILAGYTKSCGAGDSDFWLIKTMGEPTELPVHNLNTEEDFSTIQAAIDDLETKDGHTITVDPGTYKEHLLIDKPLKLIGEDKSTTIIDGGRSEKCVIVTADTVEISGFTIQNSTYGIWLESSDGCTISGKIIQDNYAGILLTDSNNNIITNNIIFNNVFSFSGIHLSSSNNNVISDNELVENDRGIFLYNSNNNLIYHNNFVDNIFKQAYDNTGTNLWDNGYPSGGNYWSDYTGVDLYRGPKQDMPGSDDIGDTPYCIPDGAGAQDRYPLMHPWEEQTKPKLIWTLTSDKKEYSQGDYVFITVELKNEGEEPVFITNPITTTFIASDGSIVLKEDLSYSISVTLGKGDQCSFWPSFKLPDDAPEGYYDVTVSFSGGKYVKTTENLFFVKAESQIPSGGGIGISIKPKDVETTPGSTITYDITVYNYYSNTESFYISIDLGSCDYDWFGWHTKSISIPGRGQGQVPLSVTPTEVGNFKFEVKANVESNPSIYASQEGNINVVAAGGMDTTPPDVTNVMVSPSIASPGSKINISADVFDSSGVRWVRAFISKGGEHVVTVFISDPDEDGIYTGTWQTINFTESGIYNIDISATDTEGNEALAKAPDVEIT